MLSEHTRQLIKATIPLLESGGEALTTHFYGIMFRDFPQVKALFNQNHQKNGQQPRALANAVLAYARHIDNPAVLGDAIQLIVHKHVSLNILPEHYPIVGSCLLQAIREVLGEVATDEIVQAWADAYQQLADLLIGAEEEVYQHTASRTGGWRGIRPFRVARKVQESAEITSFYLEPVDGGPLLAFIPGQYLALRVFLNGEEMRRNYSLSDAPNDHYYRISVKRELAGTVSHYLHDEVQAGDTLDVFAPCGSFTLRKSQDPLVLISGGVGLTPAIAMLNAVAGENRPVHFIHCARNSQVHAFREHVDALSTSRPGIHRHYLYSEPLPGDQCDASGLLDEELLKQWLPKGEADVYFLGPAPFMAMVKRQLASLGIPEARTHFEFFGPAQALA